MSRTASTLIATVALAAMMIHLVVSGDLRPGRILWTLVCAGAVVIGIVLVDLADARTSRPRTTDATPPPPAEAPPRVAPDRRRPAPVSKNYARVSPADH